MMIEEFFGLYSIVYNTKLNKVRNGFLHTFSYLYFYLYFICKNRQCYSNLTFVFYHAYKRRDDLL